MPVEVIDLLQPHSATVNNNVSVHRALQILFVILKNKFQLRYCPEKDITQFNGSVCFF